MSTHFDTGFDNGEFIESVHLSQFAQPINDLESGAAHFRVATNDSGNYQVDFQTTANVDGHSIDILNAGQAICFKASHTSAANAELKVLINGSSVTHPIFLAGSPLRAGEISTDQIVEVIYNDTAVPRFDVAGMRTSQGLDDLGDVSLNSPSTGQTIRHNGSNFVNDSLQLDDVPGLSSAISSAGGNPTGALAQIDALNLSSGDMLTVNSSGEVARLPAGTDGHVLKMTSGVPAWGEDLGGGVDSGGLLTAGLVATGHHYESISSTSIKLRSSAFVPILDEYYLVRYIANHSTSVGQLDLAGARSNSQPHFCRAEETQTSIVHDIGFSSSGGGDYICDSLQRTRPIDFIWKANVTNQVEIVLGQDSLTYGAFTGTLLVYRLQSSVIPLGWGAFPTSNYSWLDDATETSPTVGGGAYRTISLDSSKTYLFVGNWTTGYCLCLVLKQGSNYWQLPPNSSSFNSVASSQLAWSGGTYYEYSYNGERGELIRHFTPPGTGSFELGCNFYNVASGCFYLKELG